MAESTSFVPRLSIAHLLHFLLVAENGGFRAAASLANRSVSALSLSIREAEARLGQQLFEPENRNVLTPFGQQCLPMVRDLVRQHRAVGDSMEKLARGESGEIVIACIVTAISYWLPNLMPAYVGKHPNVKIHLLDDHSANIERMALADEIDLGLCSPVSNDPRLSFEGLVTDRFGLVCRRDHPLANRTSITWAELSGLPLIGTTAHRPLMSFEPAEPLRRATLFTSQMTALLSMLQHGMGVTVLPRLGVPPGQDEITYIPLIQPVQTRVVGILTRTGRTASPAVQAMIAMLREYCHPPVSETM